MQRVKCKECTEQFDEGEFIVQVNIVENEIIIKCPYCLREDVFLLPDNYEPLPFEPE